VVEKPPLFEAVEKLKEGGRKVDATGVWAPFIPLTKNASSPISCVLLGAGPKFNKAVLCWQFSKRPKSLMILPDTERERVAVFCKS